jgi:hypothetical protein
MTTTTFREWITASIHRIASGETFTRKDFDARPVEGWNEVEPKSGISHSEKDPAFFAWMALRRWADDDDIRAKDPAYGDMKKRELQSLLERMQEKSLRT